MEEYERELARARWRLKKLREEVKQAKRKVEEAGERNTPLQDSIRQSYEEILQVPADVHIYICVCVHCMCVSVSALTIRIRAQSTPFILKEIHPIRMVDLNPSIMY